MRRYILLAFLGLAFANWVAWSYVLEGTNLRVTFFDVGQGDAILIETPQGHQMLIDGGPGKKVEEKVAKALPFWDKSLDLVILTHPDADHITGLVGVLEQYEVENVLWTGVETDTNIFTAWKNALEKERLKSDIEQYLARAGQKVVWTQDENVFMEILYPESPTLNGKKSGFDGPTNDTSIVSKLVFGNHSFLFTGDITKAVEQKFVDQGADLRADVLKVPHHGSKYSSSEAFLAAVAPTMAVIQVGANNSYGHPTQEVLSRLGNIPVLRTDRDSDIVIEL